MEKIKKSHNYTNESFENIKHIDEEGTEFWYARELMTILEYNKWENFEKVINKAKDACANSGITVIDHFPDVRKLSKRANNAEVIVKDYKLTRYACYLIAQNGDSRKKVIAKNGGTMPKELPTPEKSLKQLEKEKNTPIKF